MPVTKRRRTTKAKPRTREAALQTSTSGEIVRVLANEPVVTVKLMSGVELPALLPQHVNRDWLLAAVEMAPVICVVTPGPKGDALVSAVYASDAHADIEVDLELKGRRIVLRANQSLEVRCRRGVISISEEGNVTVMGQDVVSRARRTNHVRGGTVRLN